ncbi:ferric reductase-like transmembrane domain-containing protein [Pseudofrankia asymbiotica]|uniref:ferric reductase-like transmembrane domain-containing protein n=1 Tax=Pseudofrankia asymbiotica TaxID=1834516 RepID=UPI0009D78FA4|nr:ferric reductase-like transmembrane domain-containing protein [Pseudofrankia asymbiotica]
MTNDVLWYTARGTGMTLLLVLTLTVVLGIAARSGRPAAGLAGFALATVHRDASLLAVALLAIHVTTLVADPFAQVAVLDVVLPFRAAYRPLWVGLGTVALDLLVALVATSLLRRRIGARAWRALHWAAYATWPLAFAHSLGSGSDVGTRWQVLVAVVCAGAVLLAIGWRCSAAFLTTRGTTRTSGRPGGRPHARSGGGVQLSTGPGGQPAGAPVGTERAR